MWADGGHSPLGMESRDHLLVSSLGEREERAYIITGIRASGRPSEAPSRNQTPLFPWNGILFSAEHSLQPTDAQNTGGSSLKEASAQALYVLIN